MYSHSSLYHERKKKKETEKEKRKRKQGMQKAKQYGYKDKYLGFWEGSGLSGVVALGTHPSF